MNRQRTSRALAVGAALLLPLAAVACGDESAGPEKGTDVEDLTDDYFVGDANMTGRTVTVSAEVTKIISSTAFQLSGEDHGDDTLLVLHKKEAPNVNEGNVVQVTGTVRDFVYADYEDPYVLADPGVYEDCVNEQFLVAQSIDKSVPQEGN